MVEMTQQDFLKAAKAELGMKWDELAIAAGIEPRALKTYRMPVTSKDFRVMRSLARSAVERLLQDYRKQADDASKVA